MPTLPNGFARFVIVTDCGTRQTIVARTADQAREKFYAANLINHLRKIVSITPA